MDYLNYFGFEETLGTIIESMVFVVFVSLFIITRKSKRNSWLRYFHYAMGFMSLTYVLPLLFTALSFVVLEDLAERYVGLIALVCFSIPTVLACFCLIMVYRKRHENA